MRKIDRLTVKYQGQTVGVLAETRNGKSAFQYDKAWQAEEETGAVRQHSTPTSIPPFSA